MLEIAKISGHNNGQYTKIMCRVALKNLKVTATGCLCRHMGNGGKYHIRHKTFNTRLKRNKIQINGRFVANRKVHTTVCARNNECLEFRYTIMEIICRHLIVRT